MAAETALGNLPRDVSAEKKGYDIESRDPRSGHLAVHRGQGPARRGARRDHHQERNPGLAECARRLHLALVRVEGGFADEPVYVRRFFTRELAFAETAIVFNLDDLREAGDRPK